MTTSDPTGPSDALQGHVSVELLQRHDRPGPRYTSYPTANLFTEAVGEAEAIAHLAHADAVADEPLSLYVHLPFCAHRCTFCGCNVIITRKRDVIESYVQALLRELDLLAARLPHRRRVSQYHWGGGTPTHLTLDQMARLQARVREHFEFDSDAEAAVEVDPRVTTREQLELLRELGFGRLSMGVQDLDPDVQAAIGRGQTEASTRALVEHARAVGFASINIDLIYGLPLQTRSKMGATVASVLDMAPDRIALYSYAHVPWIQGHQRKIVASQLPEPAAKLGLFVCARDGLLAGGYRAIGMDHFARPADELAQAAARWQLHRNFMGYTVRSGSDMIAVGTSAISDVRGAFLQNTKKLSRYLGAIDAGRLPVERGYVRSRDDEIRRHAIAQIMCRFRLDAAELADRFGVRARDYFARELAELVRPGGLVDDGFVRIASGGDLEVTGLGRLFVRNVAMVFDAHLPGQGADGSGRARFSRTV